MNIPFQDILIQALINGVATAIVYYLIFAISRKFFGKILTELFLGQTLIIFTSGFILSFVYQYTGLAKKFAEGLFK